MCWDNEGGQYRRVKAFGDKPWLMTRKSKAALIYTGPLAHRGKAVCYTKKTPNLLRDMLNIPPLLGTKKEDSVSPFYGCNSKQSAGLHPISLLVFRENQREHEGKRELWVGGLAARWKEGLFWSQCGIVSTKLEQVFFGGFWEDFRINHWHCIAEPKPKEDILISFWMWKLSFLKWHHHHFKMIDFTPYLLGLFCRKSFFFFFFLLRLEGIYRCDISN